MKIKKHTPLIHTQGRESPTRVKAEPNPKLQIRLPWHQQLESSEHGERA